MKDEYLASGFADVDRSGDARFYSSCLSLLDSLPYFKWYKQESYKRLRLSPGLSVLDLGCGIGDDAFRIAARIAPGGRVVGVDASAGLIAQALARQCSLAGAVSFALADARRLPFPDQTFDRVRIDRTLQHIAGPQKVVDEMFRVLKPGGLAVAYDNDWGSYSLSSTDPTMTRLVEDEWRYSLTNPWIGRHLRLFFLRSGFTAVTVMPSVSVISDFDTADRVYDITRTVDRLAASSKVSEEARDSWLAGLREQSAEGGFQCALTAYLACGSKVSQ